MAKIEGYSLERQKSLGAFYTPPTLANYLAKVTLSLAKLDKAKKYFVLDPATGESADLLCRYRYRKNSNSKIE